MDVTLPPDLRKQVEQELATGRYQISDELMEQAARRFLDDCERGQQRLDALRRSGHAVDRAGLYERVLVPGYAAYRAAKMGCIIASE
jgi:Arc/MetJ-type ribon-helix-helix transcriptional regulator